MTIAMYFSLGILIIFVVSAAGGEDDVLKALVTGPMTGYRITGVSCFKAMQVAVNAANERKDFLKGFKVELEPGNDGFGPLGVKAVGNFFRNHIESRSDQNDTSYPAPIATGFLTTLNCQSVAPIMPHINMAMVSVGCNSPIFSDQHRYRNMYRISKGIEKNVGPILEIFKSFQWDKIALLFTQNNILIYNLANELMAVASDYNVSVVWSNNVNSVDGNVVESLKQSKARVIFLTNPEPHLTTKLLCQLYKQGFYDSKYIFIAMTSTMYEKEFTPPIVPGGCTRQQLRTMYNIVLFIGSRPLPLNNLGNVSYLGYDLDDFNQRYNQMMENYTKNPFRIHKCHDGMLQTLIGLHNANEKLISSKNMTLRDYLTHPEEVYGQVKEALSETSFKGILMERYFYGEIAEFVDEPLSIMQWTDGERWEYPYDAVFDEMIGKYSIKQVSPIQWITKDGKPPKGWPNVVKTSYDIPFVFFIVVSVCSTMLVPIEAYLLIPTRQFLQFFGLLALNLSCTVIAIPTALLPNLLPVCQTRLVTLAIGFVIPSMSLLFESFYIWKLLAKRKGQPGSSRSRSTTIGLLIWFVEVLNLLFFIFINSFISNVSWQVEKGK